VQISDTSLKAALRYVDSFYFPPETMAEASGTDETRDSSRCHNPIICSGYSASALDREEKKRETV
jgi:hypothetical protein